MSLRTSHRPTALRLGVGALAVFEELLSMETEAGLIHLMEHIIQELDLRPEDMTSDDVIRRRALQIVGNKLIRQVGDVRIVDRISGPLREEFAHFNYVTVQGEGYLDLVQKRAAGMNVFVSPRRPEPDLSSLNEWVRTLSGASPSKPVTPSNSNGEPEPATDVPSPPTRLTRPPEPATLRTDKKSAGPVWTMRALHEDYLRRDGKKTGSDNKTNLERAVKLFESVLPQGRTVPVTEIDLEGWDRLYEFMLKIPLSRGKDIDDLYELTCRLIESGEDYRTLSPATLNSNYNGALVRLINHGNKRRVIAMAPPHMVVKDKKRASTGKSREAFSAPEITAITRSPVYAGSASIHRRYSAGNVIKFDDHVYWAPLIAAHTGMRVSEIGMLQLDQFQDWFGRTTIMLEATEESAARGEGYKTINALRRVPVHQQLIDIGLLDFAAHQRAKGLSRVFPDWTQHVKGGVSGQPEIHYEADFFNAHRLKWNVPAARAKKLSFHSFRGFFIQACRDARVDPYTALKWVGHDDGLKAQTNEVHAGYMSKDLTEKEVGEINRVVVPLAAIIPFRELLQRRDE